MFRRIFKYLPKIAKMLCLAGFYLRKIWIVYTQLGPGLPCGCWKGCNFNPISVDNPPSHSMPLRLQTWHFSERSNLPWLMALKWKKYPKKDLTPGKCTTSTAKSFLADYVTILFCIAYTLCQRHFYLINMLYKVGAWQLLLYFVFQGGKKWLGDIDAWGHAMDSADPGMTTS